MTTAMDVANSVMNQSSYPKRTVLIAIVLFIPSIILTWVVIKDDNKRIATTQIEQDGLHYINTVLQLYKAVPQHRGIMTNGDLNDDSPFQVLEKRGDISADIAAIDAIDAELGEQFQTTALWTDIKQDWDQLSEQSFMLAPQEVFDRHTTLIIKIAALFEQISNYSGLTLDPELNATRIIDTLVTKLPIVTERLARARGLGTNITASGMATMQGNIKLNTLVTEINLNSQSAIDHLSAVMSDNKQVADALSEILNQRQTAMSTFSKAIHDEILNRQIIQIDSSEFFGLGSDAIKINFQLQNALLPILHNLFEQRISNIRFQRNMILTIIATTFIIAIILFMKHFKSIARNDTANSMANIADMNVQVKEHGSVSEGVNRNINNVSDLSSQKMTGRQTVSANSQSLADIAAELDQIVDRFKV